MEADNGMETYIYRIDESDTIRSVSGNWWSFAEENNDPGRCRPDNQIGSSLWDYIHGIEVRHLYKAILQRARETKRQSAAIPFRCDSPDTRRFLELRIIPLEDGAMEFRSWILRTEPREPAALLDVRMTRSDEFLRICSMCKKVAVSDSKWEEVEAAVVALDLFGRDHLPQLTHGLCPACRDATLADLDMA